MRGSMKKGQIHQGQSNLEYNKRTQTAIVWATQIESSNTFPHSRSADVVIFKERNFPGQYNMSRQYFIVTKLENSYDVAVLTTSTFKTYIREC